MEMILEGERKKAREMREKLEADMNNERRIKAEFENKII